MAERPDAAQLLGIARAALVDDLLPALPASLRYTCRMVANAIAIAEREVAASRSDGAVAQERVAVDGMAGTVGEPDWRSIVARLRAGAFDSDDALRARVHAALLADAQARVAVSNPRMLVQGYPE